MNDAGHKSALEAREKLPAGFAVLFLHKASRCATDSSLIIGRFHKTVHKQGAVMLRGRDGGVRPR